MGESKSFEFAIDQLTEAGHNLLQFAKENPVVFSLGTVTIAAGVATIVVPLAVGFGPAGPVAGSLAAAWMSSIGSVAAGSFFAMLQSLTMTGTLLAVGGAMIGVGILGLMGGDECMKHLQEFSKGVDWKKANPKEVEWLKGDEWFKKTGEEMMKGCEEFGKGCQEFGEQTQKGCEEFGEQMKEGGEGAADEMKKGFEGFAGDVQSAFGG